MFTICMGGLLVLIQSDSSHFFPKRPQLSLDLETWDFQSNFQSLECNFYMCSVSFGAEIMG